MKLILVVSLFVSFVVAKASTHPHNPSSVDPLPSTEPVIVGIQLVRGDDVVCEMGTGDPSVYKTVDRLLENQNVDISTESHFDSPCELGDPESLALIMDAYAYPTQTAALGLLAVPPVTCALTFTGTAVARSFRYIGENPDTDDGINYGRSLGVGVGLTLWSAAVTNPLGLSAALVGVPAAICTELGQESTDIVAGALPKLFDKIQQKYYSLRLVVSTGMGQATEMPLRRMHQNQ